jgi:hypothetical protein
MSASLGHGLQAEIPPAALPVGETGCASGVGAFAGTRLQGLAAIWVIAPVRRRSWAEGAPQRAEGGALSPLTFKKAARSLRDGRSPALHGRDAAGAAGGAEGAACRRSRRSRAECAAGPSPTAGRSRFASSAIGPCGLAVQELSLSAARGVAGALPAGRGRPRSSARPQGKALPHGPSLKNTTRTNPL